MAFWKSSQEYSPLSEDVEEPSQAFQRRWPSLFASIFSVASFVFLISISIGVGFQFGRWTAPIHEEIQANDLLQPFGETVRIYSPNFTFIGADHDQSHALLMSQAPSERGFVRDPVVAPVIGIPGFYHQLHCLYAIREGYRVAARNLTVDRMTDGEHMAHCFEYLRNAILCAADSNIEPFDYETGGVNGWNEHQCRDFESVLEWSREHALSPKEVHEFYVRVKENPGKDLG